MPQLDTFAFAPQVFWLIFVFFVLYFSVLKNGLTRIYKIFLFRKRFILSLNTQVLGGTRELLLLRVTLFRFLVNFGSFKSTLDTFSKVVDTSTKFALRQTYFTRTGAQGLFFNQSSIKSIAGRQWLTSVSSQEPTFFKTFDVKKIN